MGRSSISLMILVIILSARALNSGLPRRPFFLACDTEVRPRVFLALETFFDVSLEDPRRVLAIVDQFLFHNINLFYNNIVHWSNDNTEVDVEATSTATSHGVIAN